MNKTVWYISKYAVTPEDGNPTRQFFMSKYLAKKGFNTILISSKSAGIKNVKIKGLYRKKEIDGIKHLLINGPEINLGFSIKRIFSWIIFETLLFVSPLFYKSKKPDIIIVSSLSLLTVITGYFFKKIYKAKLIFEVRDIWPLSLIELKNISSENLFVKFLSFVERFGYKKSDYIVGTMPALDVHIKDTIKKQFKFKCIPMGYDPDFYKNQEEIPEKIRDKIPGDKFLCGYAGSIGNANSVETIISAAEILNEKNDKIYFLILGEGSLKQTLIKRCEKLQNISFLPGVPKKQVQSFLQKCDVLLNPWQNKKIYQYGVSPNKWIDYMYAAKPVIVSFGGYKSIINEADCGDFVQPENPEALAGKILEYFEKEKNKLQKIGENGKKYLENNLSYDKLAELYIEIFNNV